MRVRAGIVLIQEGKVALIERHRAGLDYFVFPGGGVDEGESPEQAAIREAMEELGVEVAIQQESPGLFLGTPDGRRVWDRDRRRVYGRRPREPRRGSLHSNLDAHRAAASSFEYLSRCSDTIGVKVCQRWVDSRTFGCL